MPKINQEEYEVLKGLDDKWKWIVRNDEWQLEVRKDKPFKKGHVWSEEVTNHSFSNDIDLDLFHFIQWNDINGHEEPYNIQELIEEYEDSKEYKDSLVIEYFMDKAKESEETEVKKDLDWVIQEIHTTRKVLADSESSGNETADEFTFNNGKEAGLVDVLKLLDQLDESEVLSQKWISENVEYAYFDMLDGSGRLSSATAIIKPEKLQNLLVPKQEEIDQAYKDGYEKGKQHTFYKGYLEGLADKEKEPETVADVVSTFWKSFERLKEVMSMEVEELEE